MVITMVSPGAGRDAEAVISSLSTWQISSKYCISTLKTEPIQNKQHCGLAAVLEVWDDDHRLTIGHQPQWEGDLQEDRSLQGPWRLCPVPSSSSYSPLWSPPLAPGALGKQLALSLVLLLPGPAHGSDQWWEPPPFITEEIVPSTDINNSVPRKRGAGAYLPDAHGHSGSCQLRKHSQRAMVVGQPHE